MDQVLSGLSDFALPYWDDVAVFSDSWSEHLRHLREVLGRFQQAGLTVKPEKCQLVKGYVTYLGHVIGQGVRKPAEANAAALRAYRRPRTKTDVRAFLGLTGYYQQYIHNYSEIASPRTDSLRK